MVWYYNNVCGKFVKKNIIVWKSGYYGVIVVSGSMIVLLVMYMVFDLFIDCFYYVSCLYFVKFVRDGEMEEDFVIWFVEELD